MLILPYLWESLQKHMGFIANVSKALQFAFFNIYLPNQKNKYMLVTFPCVAASQILKAAGWGLQWAVCCWGYLFSLARKALCLPYSLQRQWSKLPFSSHLCLNVVPNRMIQLEMNLEIKLNLVWLGHNFSFTAFIFPLFWIVDSPTNWSSTFYLRMKLLVGVKRVALGRSVWILKQDLAHRGSGQHWAVPAVGHCPSPSSRDHRGEGGKKGVSYGNSNTNLETMMQKHLPRLTDSHFTHKRKPMWGIWFPLLKSLFIHFESWSLNIPGHPVE